MDLYQHSIDVILSNQHSSGAYIACPSFPTYHFSWLRDGTFIGYAMDMVGEHDSAEKFYRWVGSTINRYAEKVDVLAQQIRSGKTPDHRGILNARFTLDGIEESQESLWGNFQVDGYGSWLWGLAEHVRLTGDDGLLAELSGPINTTLNYLQLVWQQPNYDCWEEHHEYLHPYSLATTYAGAKAVSDLIDTGKLQAGAVDPHQLAGEVKAFIADHAVVNGRLIKHFQFLGKDRRVVSVINGGVDASMLGVAIPCRVFDLGDPVIVETVRSIENDLHRKNGGVYRYKQDVYYGGGEWILLSAWLGLYYAQVGEKAKAAGLQRWIENNAGENGDLPEQVSDHVLAPDHLEPWLDKWGPVASPLLWSHAMYLLLVKALEVTN